MTPFDRHERAVLQFSGGKDSLACLYLLRAFWDRITVLWVNTGDAFPETIAQMGAVRAMVPHFLEVKSNQPEQLAESGYPFDVVNTWELPEGRMVDTTRTRKVQSPLNCCAANLWWPALHACRALNATLIIRGQRAEEERKATIRSGHVADGVEHWFPIEDWTREELRVFLLIEGVPLPEHYAYVDTSLDCMHCTGYLNENVGKFRYMKEHHRALYARLRPVVVDLIESAEHELAYYKQAIGA